MTEEVALIFSNLEMIRASKERPERSAKRERVKEREEEAEY